MSKPQLNHNSTQPKITLSWVRHEAQFSVQLKPSHYPLLHTRIQQLGITCLSLHQTAQVCTVNRTESESEKLNLNVCIFLHQPSGAAMGALKPPFNATPTEILAEAVSKWPIRSREGYFLYPTIHWRWGGGGIKLTCIFVNVYYSQIISFISCFVFFVELHNMKWNFD